MKAPTSIFAFQVTSNLFLAMQRVVRSVGGRGARPSLPPAPQAAEPRPQRWFKGRAYRILEEANVTDESRLTMDPPLPLPDGQIPETDLPLGEPAIEVEDSQVWDDEDERSQGIAEMAEKLLRCATQAATYIELLVPNKFTRQMISDLEGFVTDATMVASRFGHLPPSRHSDAEVLYVWVVNRFSDMKPWCEQWTRGPAFPGHEFPFKEIDVEEADEP